MSLRSRLAAVLPVPLKRFLRQLPHWARWLVWEVPRAPGMEIYARLQNRLNMQTFRKDRAAQAAGRDVTLDVLAPKQIPQIIWTYWGQGEAEAPEVVRRCIDSWRDLNPGWEVRVLDTETAPDFVDVSDVPAHLPWRFSANAVKLRLTQRYGGVWADPTVLCHRPLEGWMPLHTMSGFFVLSDPAPDRWFDNWFIISEPEGEIISIWERLYTRYLRGLRYMPDKYFMLIYVLQWHLKTHPKALLTWNRGAKLPAPPSFVLMAALEGLVDPALARSVVAQGYPISKLKWKFPGGAAEIDRILTPEAEAQKTAEHAT